MPREITAFQLVPGSDMSELSKPDTRQESVPYVFSGRVMQVLTLRQRILEMKLQRHPDGADRLRREKEVVDQEISSLRENVQLSSQVHA